MEKSTQEVPQANRQSWRDAWDIDGTVAYIRDNGFTRVTLQFPDELLDESTVVTAAIAQECASHEVPAKVSILADTTYNALNVDEVAAQHADAECVVHYGRASMSPLSCLPAYFVFGQQKLNVPATAARIANYASKPSGSKSKAVLVFMDQLLLHAAAQLQAHVQQIQQTCQQTLQVLYTEVQGRTMEPSSVVPSTAEHQTGGKHHNSCCQATPSAKCASAQATADAEAAVPAVPPHQCECAGTTRPAEQAGNADMATLASHKHAVPVMPQHMLRQSVAQAADADARTLSHTVPSSGNSAVQTSQASDIHSHTNANVGPVNAEQKQTTQSSDRMTPHSNADQTGIAEAAVTSTADAMQHQDAVSRMAEGRAASGSPGVTGHIAGYTWTLPAGMRQEECTMMWVGPSDAAALTHLQLTFNKSQWVSYDPEQDKWQEGLPLHISRTLKRRYFLVEKAKNASVIGILVGTLGVAGYRDAIDSIRSLAKKAGKKTYTMLMGKPNPAKLANLPEVEVFVMVADPQGMILDSKEYYAPIITPFEAYLAFSGDAEWDGSYSLDFTSLQASQSIGGPSQSLGQPRFSLLDGAYHTVGPEHQEAASGDSLALAKRAQQALQLTGPPGQVSSASEYLQKRRVFRGLEAPLVGAEQKPVVKVVQGQTGRAAQYTHEAVS